MNEIEELNQIREELEQQELLEIWREALDEESSGELVAVERAQAARRANG
ncbi:hypothetical protein [Actinomadura sp. 6N118]